MLKTIKIFADLLFKQLIIEFGEDFVDCPNGFMGLGFWL